VRPSHLRSADDDLGTGPQPPAVEPAGGARGIEPHGLTAGDLPPLREMAPRVQQHVGERAPHLARGAEAAVVIAAVEHRAAPLRRAVQRAREPCRDALHPARERVLAVRLDDQVRVVALERVVVDAEVAALGGLGEGAAELAHEGDGAKGGHADAHAERHVHRCVDGNRRALAVQHPRARASRAARTRAGTAAAGPLAVVGEGELLRSTRHGHRLGLCFGSSRVRTGDMGNSPDREHGGDRTARSVTVRPRSSPGGRVPSAWRLGRESRGLCPRTPVREREEEVQKRSINPGGGSHEVGQIWGALQLTAWPGWRVVRPSIRLARFVVCCATPARLPLGVPVRLGETRIDDQAVAVLRQQVPRPGRSSTRGSRCSASRPGSSPSCCPGPVVVPPVLAALRPEAPLARPRLEERCRDLPLEQLFAVRCESSRAAAAARRVAGAPERSRGVLSSRTSHRSAATAPSAPRPPSRASVEADGPSGSASSSARS
jgi:hypothetical protein